MYEIDPSKPETLINVESPDVPDWFVKELRKLGGTQYDGTPNLQVVWGQSERKYACGKMRVKYPTPYYAEREQYQFRLRNVDTGEVTECTYGQFMEVKAQYNSADPNIKFIPQFKVKRDVEWIGIPRFIIEQLTPVTMFQDSPSNWESNRFGWYFNPETRQREWTDLIGPYPYKGRYDHFLTIEEDYGDGHKRYCPPTQREIEVIKKALRGRENYERVPDEVGVRQFIEAQKAKLSKSEAELSDQIADSLAPHTNQMYEVHTKFYNPGTTQKASKTKGKR